MRPSTEAYHNEPSSSIIKKAFIWPPEDLETIIFPGARKLLAPIQGSFVLVGVQKPPLLHPTTSASPLWYVETDIWPSSLTQHWFQLIPMSRLRVPSPTRCPCPANSPDCVPSRERVELAPLPSKWGHSSSGAFLGHPSSRLDQS